MEQEFELAHVRSKVAELFRSKVETLPYIPTRLETPARMLPISSAWSGLEMILGDIIERFHLGHERCLEFGVEYGFSTVALSSYFGSVTGVDTFQGDRHTNNMKDIYAEALSNLAPYDNIQVIKSDYRDFIAKDQGIYDLVHVDIIHTYADTFRCGLWSARHSPCTIFHDTESFPPVKQAGRDIARETGKKFYNFEQCYGLGIVA